MSSPTTAADHPLVQEGNRLLINARIENRGSVRMEVQDANGNVLPGTIVERAK